LAVRILVADDNSTMRAALRLVLEETGQWEIVEAANGEEALDLARQQTFNLVILDLAMPGMDGISVARVLTDRYPTVPILMHTLYWSRRVAMEALKAGVRKVIPKSDRATILNGVREILQMESAKAQLVEPAAEAALADVTTIPSSASLGNTAEKLESPSDSSASDGSVPKA
jgi:two-component system, NarL family, invasion response regulator UvrY